MIYRVFIVFFFAFFNTAVFSQDEKFTFTEEGLNEFIVVNVNDTISKKILFEKTLNWVKETYVKPNEVLDAKIEYESIRLTAIGNFFRIYNTFGNHIDFPVVYTIKISFKQGKYKFEVMNMIVKHDRIDYSDIPSKIYKKNGKLIKWYRDTPTEIENHFNSLNESLLSYIKGLDNKNDW